MAKEGALRKGLRFKKVHGKCRRCGKTSFHLQKGICASCGFGKSSRLRSYAWTRKK
jgi:large subunit ribosomal protein L37e